MSATDDVFIPCDAEHGWCQCGEWHENPEKEKRRLGSKEHGLTLWSIDSGLSYDANPREKLRGEAIKRGAHRVDK